MIRKAFANGGGIGVPGARGHNSGSAVLNEVTGWQPGIVVRKGIERACRWIAGEPAKRGGGNAALRLPKNKDSE